VADPEADSFPLAYHITIRCYGTRLHGDESGSVHHDNSIFGTPILPHKPALRQHEEDIMDQPPYEMDSSRRQIVLETIRQVCSYRGWDLYAAHVRVNHWHVVVQANCPPEKILHDLKAYASRNLTKANLDNKDRKRWARHGSTQYKWTEDDVESAIHYVIREQGEPMEFYEKQ
jgi:REP element-mobilizing transposase RayT